jgi:hypothetical protein
MIPTISGAIELLDHERREKLVFGHGNPKREYLSQAKAGGTWLPMSTALKWWFLADRDPTRTSCLLGGVLWDYDGHGTYTICSKLPVGIGKDYTDVTAQVEQEITEAETLAKPHHFHRLGHGTRVQGGFLETVRAVWMKTR